ncbi:hypothetical protein FQA39_LY02991 [Lamprigera yunnana]|nr:hypothetical protein FQA39_LY02991 [Lamprigera yunnana]
MKMSQSGAVYQPTTVTYEANTSPQDRWSERPISYLTSFTRTTGNPCGLTCLPSRNIVATVLLSSSLVLLAVGLILLINGAIGFSDSQKQDDSFYLVATIVGAILFGLGIILLGLFLRQSRRFCCHSGKDALDPTTGQALTVNPSTDLLVAAQYAPVSEVAYQPPTEDTEQSKLMPQENKESNEDTDRMIERDPRIVLSPLNPTTHEDA